MKQRDKRVRKRSAAMKERVVYSKKMESKRGDKGKKNMELFFPLYISL